MYVAFRLGTKKALLGATNAAAQVKIQIEVSCVWSTTKSSEINF